MGEDTKFFQNFSTFSLTRNSMKNQIIRICTKEKKNTKTYLVKLQVHRKKVFFQIWMVWL